ncbi:hypothetical protein TGARI_372920 [Toxoplasma gondii ARI]|uniref:Uncharacterized protein n=1 Tax=Toxoplasma gondii ARI TaxID=1074872 RepID=A0A139XI35_TOXGO|nr:hypothetical protein TGARI_372920 [Toxoplasma gondii ARI]
MTCCRYPSESECPAWDAWANPVAEANDPSSLASEYAACGVWRPHTVLPFSRMSLVSFLRGWAAEVRQRTKRGPVPFFETPPGPRRDYY